MATLCTIALLWGIYQVADTIQNRRLLAVLLVMLVMATTTAVTGYMRLLGSRAVVAYVVTVEAEASALRANAQRLEAAIESYLRAASGRMDENRAAATAFEGLGTSE